MSLLPVLAQAASNNDAAVAGVMIVVILVILGIALGLYIVMALIQSRALKSLPESARKCNPIFPWLTIIPLAGFVFLIICYLMIPSSFVGHFGENDAESKSAKTIGIVCVVLLCCSIIPFVGALAGLGHLICLIIYLVKINALGKRALATA